MTLSISNPRAKKRWSALSIIVGLGLLLGMMLPMSVMAAPPKISLEQCRNGSASAPNDCEVLGGSSGWQNGNAGASNAHFVEGHSIPYRALLTDTPSGLNTVQLGYDVKHSGVHAIDFLTHFQRLEPHSAFGHGPGETVSPLSGVDMPPGFTTATCSIPDPGNLSTDALATFTQIKNVEDKNDFTVYGAAEGSCTVTQDTAGDLDQNQSEARVTITFTATSSTVVMAWGGHIARSPDWQPAGGAAQISGSPYHMRLKAWSAGNVGNQDRSLSAAAVIAEQSTTATTLHFADDTPVPLTSGVGVAPLGSTIHDLATVTGFNPTGTVTFTFFRGGDCTSGTPDAAVAADTVTLASINSTTSVAHPSPSKGPLTAGDYAFRAAYSGDANNIESTSACEPFTVGKGTLTLTTEIHLGTDHATNYDANAGGGAVAINSVVHDVALISGAATGVTPTGTISFSMWDNGTCDGTADRTLASAGADGTGIKSVATSALAPGQYSFMAHITADSNYNADDSPCEKLVVNKDTSDTTTQPAATVVTRATLNDSVTVTGTNPSGNVTFKLWTTNTAGVCSGELYAETVALSSGTASTTGGGSGSNVVQPTATTTYYWTADYEGDANNAASSSDCGEETVTVTPGSASTFPAAP